LKPVDVQRRAMDSWLERAERLCYEGEAITERVRLGDGGVVVTTHRMLAFSPDGEGPNFQQADRPNVTGVRRDDGGDAGWLQRGLEALLVGAVLVVAGWSVDFEGMFGDVSLAGANQVSGLGGVLGLIEGVLAVLAVLDDLMLAGGAIALLVTVATFGVYLRTRETTLRVEVAGDDDLRVPVDPWPEGEDVREQLRRAIAPAEGGSDPAPSDDPLA
jgi:hypothetical protein